MLNISALIDLGGVGLSVEQVKSYAASENIANVNNPNYLTKTADFNALLAATTDAVENNGVAKEDLHKKTDYLLDQPDKKISLDEEVLNLSSAQLRYQVISQIIQKKFGVMDLALGVKR